MFWHRVRAFGCVLSFLWGGQKRTGGEFHSFQLVARGIVGVCVFQIISSHTRFRVPHPRSSFGFVGL